MTETTSTPVAEAVLTALDDQPSSRDESHLACEIQCSDEKIPLKRWQWQLLKSQSKLVAEMTQDDDEDRVRQDDEESRNVFVLPISHFTKSVVEKCLEFIFEDITNKEALMPFVYRGRAFNGQLSTVPCLTQDPFLFRYATSLYEDLMKKRPFLRSQPKRVALVLSCADYLGIDSLVEFIMFLLSLAIKEHAAAIPAPVFRRIALPEEVATQRAEDEAMRRMFGGIL